jgi:NAD(P)-dependent dehydrogenase (short-subunit alcohol dehydrogenase family)
LPALSKTVLITGASSGLGRAAAMHLGELGYRVLAAVRSETAAAELSSAPSAMGELIPLILDVTDSASIDRAVAVVQRACTDTGLWAVVNNAGTAVSAPLECVPVEVLRIQLETNVIGAFAVSQRFLPMLRQTKGRIVNVSSGIGSVTPPFVGAYATSQFAKEGMSDALRREVAPHGVSVSVVQPGAVNTPIWGKMHETADRLLAEAPVAVADLYRVRFENFLESNDARARAAKTTPEDYARTVASALAARRPKIRYRVGVDARTSALARRLLPDRLMDTLIAAGLKAG